MKFFIDTADVAEIKSANLRGWVDGVTTNPSLVAKTGLPLRELIKTICKEVSGDIWQIHLDIYYFYLCQKRLEIPPDIGQTLPIEIEGGNLFPSYCTVSIPNWVGGEDTLVTSGDAIEKR